MIHVLAGVNGAGKSSIGGSAIRAAGGDWYNPDEIARTLVRKFPDRSITEINATVWKEGNRRLERAILRKEQFVFETTLGGQTITNSLFDAISCGVGVAVWYCGLESPDLHIKRVAARVARGGHDIPSELIRHRYARSMRNLCRLAPGLKELAVYDNSQPLNEHGKPDVRKLIHVRDRRIVYLDARIPQWAKPVASVVLKHRLGGDKNSSG